MQKDNDKEPIYYCNECKSLRIIGDSNVCFCDECGSTDIKETTIDNYLNNIKNGDSKGERASNDTGRTRN